MDGAWIYSLCFNGEEIKFSLYCSLHTNATFDRLLSYKEIFVRSYLKMQKPHHYLLLFNLAIITFCIWLCIFILWKVQMNIKQITSLFAVLILSLFLGFLWTSYFDLKKELAYLLKIDKLLEKEQG